MLFYVNFYLISYTIRLNYARLNIASRSKFFIIIERAYFTYLSSFSITYSLYIFTFTTSDVTKYITLSSADLAFTNLTKGQGQQLKEKYKVYDKITL